MKRVMIVNKADIVKDMRGLTGSGFITRIELAKYMGTNSPKSVDRYLTELERIDNKYYFIPDVAESILSRRGCRNG